MKKRIFVTATNTDIGKTYTTKLLLREFASRGFRVGAIKPIETGVIDADAKDAKELFSVLKELNSEFNELSIEDIVPITYELPASPFVASGGEKLDLDKIKRSIEKLERYCDILIIEGAGGLFVPVDADLVMLDLIKEFNASALLVTHCSLGCINDTLLSKRVLEDAKIKHQVAFNCREEDENFEVISLPYFLKSGFEVMKVEENIDTICDVLYNL
ncbi:MAG: dethiobiotin synthase [Sulfurimonas sp.]|uniref:dethiobiotin synthase n=1 Tax=Sulfurimonas sp. TaxID=2022749 RepID=UPI0025EAF5EF|nr:dethiobiotin synthase [Sulfurimonas sp.]MCK9491644.1 dethiobiotin synthase [Sulfurimonas sp.]